MVLSKLSSLEISEVLVASIAAVETCNTVNFKLTPPTSYENHQTRHTASNNPNKCTNIEPTYGCIGQ